MGYNSNFSTNSQNSDHELPVTPESDDTPLSSEQIKLLLANERIKTAILMLLDCLVTVCAEARTA